VIAAIVAVVLVGAVTVAAVANRSGEGGAGTSTSAGSRPPSSVGKTATATPGVSVAPSGRPGTELTLLAGKVVVAARPGWEVLADPGENVGSVGIELRGPGGRALLGTLTIATLSDPSAFDTTLQLDGGTSFEFTGTDGPFRATAQPGLAGRVVAGASRPRGAFYMNLSVFALDNGALDALTLRQVSADQVAPALRFP